MDDTKKLIEKYKRELMELSKTAPQTTPAAKPEPAKSPEKDAAAKSPKVIGYVSEESAEFPAVFDRIIAQAVENNEVETKRSESTIGYPDIDSETADDVITASDEVLFNEGRDPLNDTEDAPDNASEGMAADDPDNADVLENGDGNRPEDNMNQGTGEPISNFPVSKYSTYEEFEAANTGGGALEFMVFTASGALPVKGAAIAVTTRIDGEPHKMFDAVTNQSGETRSQTLPAPSKELSQNSGNAIQPFSLYDASISRDGFTRVILRDIPIFDGVRSIQRVAMIPETTEDPENSNNNELVENEQTTNSPARETSEVRNAK